jgi:type VI secretion system FHA domain protein
MLYGRAMPLMLTLTPMRAGARPEVRTITDGTLSIGRGPGNDWVLPDEERLLSKTHCVIAAQGGRFVLTDLSTNGVYFNGGREPTRRDGQVVLNDGDQFRLGDYNVVVAEIDHAQGARGADPFASAPAAAPAGFAARLDPLGGDGLDDPFADGAGTLFRHPLQPAALAPRRADPFDLAGPSAGRLDADDDLFRGLTPADNWQGPSQPDNADAPQQAFLPPKPLAIPAAGEIDFDALLGDEPIGAAPPARTAPPPSPPEAFLPASVDALDAWLPEPAAAFATPPAPQPAPNSISPPPSAVQPQAVTPAQGAQSATETLLAAFLEGAGVPGLRVGGSAEDAMRMAGQVFAALVAGLRETLMARAAIKNELRVEQTMLRARDNNALKFSVTPEEAIAALLLPLRPGYKPPLAAANEAFRDIQSHEMAVMAGVQTALTALLKRFDPVALEARLQAGLLDSVLPGARKARIWELFCATYRDIAHEAEDDFQSVFGREFARAYDAQMKEL